VDYVSDLDIISAGLVPYEEAWDRQRQLHAARVAGDIPDTVLLLEHPPVYTATRRTQPWALPNDGTPVVQTDRGGDITWHGPGQLVGYPIVALPGRRDVVAYVRRVEAMLISVCADLGLPGQRIKGRSGVWVIGGGPDRKVAALGLRVSQGVAMHGFALNCDPDLRAFDLIAPCGYTDVGATSLSRELGRDVTVAEALPVVQRHLSELVTIAADPIAV
jgi:lipoyl(octanoyl) transferase